MKLYKLSTKGFEDYYLIATNSTEAENKLIELLDKTDYGFSDDRIVKNIELITEEIKEFPKDKPHFSDKNQRLIIVDKW